MQEKVMEYLKDMLNSEKQVLEDIDGDLNELIDVLKTVKISIEIEKLKVEIAFDKESLERFRE